MIKFMNTVMDKLTDILPVVWGVLWMFIVTAGSIVAAIWVVQLFLSLVGVI